MVFLIFLLLGDLLICGTNEGFLVVRNLISGTILERYHQISNTHGQDLICDLKIRGNTVVIVNWHGQIQVLNQIYFSF